MGNEHSEPKLRRESQNTQVNNERPNLNNLEFLDIPLYYDSSASDQSKKATFSVVSYNILCGWYVRPMNRFKNFEAYKFNRRAPLILDQLRKFSADIIFLQELDDFEYFNKKLGEIGYESVFKGRHNLIVPDGCLLAYKKDIFEAIHIEFLEYDKGDRAKAHSEFRQGHIAIAAKLLHKKSGKIINAINTHFFHKQSEKHIQFYQLSELLKYIAKEYKENEIIVWGGDLNTTPHNSLIKYILERKAPISSNKGSSQVLNELYQELEQVSTNFKWKSVYQDYGKTIGNTKLSHPEYTFYVDGYRATLDYIIYNRKSLIPKKLLKIPTEKEIQTVGIPNEYFPSDHLPIMCIFETV